MDCRRTRRTFSVSRQLSKIIGFMSCNVVLTSGLDGSRKLYAV